MTDKQDDRRTHRSKQLLQSALMGLMAEKRFDKITVQDILERADVGRTTFYAHFQDKADLFLSSHDQLMRAISRSFFAENGTLCTEPSPDLLTFLELLDQKRDAYFYLTWGSDTGEVVRLLKEQIARQLAARLGELFREEDSAIPFAALGQHVAGSITSLLTWWMGERTPYAPHKMAVILHQMNQITLRNVLGPPLSNSAMSA